MLKIRLLRVPSGMVGTVIDVQVFTREGIERDKRAQSIIDEALKRYRTNLNDQLRIVENDAFERLSRQLVGAVAQGGANGLTKNKKITQEYLDNTNPHLWFDIRLADAANSRKFSKTFVFLLMKREKNSTLLSKKKKKKLTQGDELPAGVQKMVKVYIAVKRRLQPGDKMAGRHGNKGVVSRITRVEDMPYMADGRPVDIVLNPWRAFPSRMNIGQVLEVHLGWAAFGLGWRIEEMLKQERTKQVGQLREFLAEIYNRSGKKEDLDSFNG